MIPHIPLKLAHQAWEVFGPPQAIDTRKEKMRAAYEEEVARIASNLKQREAFVLENAAFLLRKYDDDTSACQEAAEFCENLADEIRRG